MTRAALCARHSSDKQSEASIEDQFRLGRDHAGRERWQIVGHIWIEHDPASRHPEATD